MVSKERIIELAPRPYDWTLGEDEYDMNWNLDSPGFEFSIHNGYIEHNDGTLYWSASKDAPDCSGVLVFCDGLIETEEDLELPFKWLKTQDHSLLNWGNSAEVEETIMSKLRGV